MSLASTGLPNSRASPALAGSSPGQHGRGLAAAVRADEPEDLAAPDAEARAIHRSEIAEAAGQIAGDDDGFAGSGSAGTNDRGGAAVARFTGESGDEGILDVGGSRRRLELVRSTGREDPPGIHRDEPVEPLGFLHVGGRNDHAHVGAPRAQTADEVPELAPRQRIDPGCRFVEDQQVRIVDQRTAQSKFPSANSPAMRPAYLVSISISSASRRPLPKLMPGGRRDCDRFHQ